MKRAAFSNCAAVGPRIAIDTRLQTIAKAMEASHEMERIWGREYLAKSKSEAGYRWRAFQREIRDNSAPEE